MGDDYAGEAWFPTHEVTCQAELQSQRLVCELIDPRMNRGWLARTEDGFLRFEVERGLPAWYLWYLWYLCILQVSMNERELTVVVLRYGSDLTH